MRHLSENEHIAQRQVKLAEWRQSTPAYPNDFRPTGSTANAHALLGTEVPISLAGRIMAQRRMGRVVFLDVQDAYGRIQIYVAHNYFSEIQYEHIKTWDLGDIIGVCGCVFHTKMGELSIRATHLILLTKSIRPMPDKFHGLMDTELRYRQRYLDLLVNDKTRWIFQTRSKIISCLRTFLEQSEFMEVETPMIQTLAGGASARPFLIHHHALNQQFALRIAPELYLKRLVVGGFERVYEIGRNFRNEGVSTRHNPEFTALELYQAYADHHMLMKWTEDVLCYLIQTVFKKEEPVLMYQGHTLNFHPPFARMTLKDSIVYFYPELQEEDLNELERIRHVAAQFHVDIDGIDRLGEIQVILFEKLVEKKLIQPTFITEFPKEASPLARSTDHNPLVTDRFELYIAGQEIANGFSELNDPEEQAMRFQEQVEAQKRGDSEAMPYDADYIKALEYGLPPTAGEGMGIDRLVMLFTDSASIRDVILFPLMKNSTTTELS